MSTCQPQFDKFVERISLGPSQNRRIDSAVKALNDHLTPYYGLNDGQIFLQGSYPNGTAVIPIAGGEYDVDVVVISAVNGETADQALDEMHKALLEHGRYAGRLVKKKPCVRIQYADDEIGSFHVGGRPRWK